MDIISDLNRYQAQFLVHSFVYYKLDMNLISDERYDHLCTNLYQMQQEHKDVLNQTRYYEITSQLDESGSGYYINDYPENIVTRALQLLYWQSDNSESFPQFISRWGYKLKR